MSFRKFSILLFYLRKFKLKMNRNQTQYCIIYIWLTTKGSFESLLEIECDINMSEK